MFLAVASASAQAQSGSTESGLRSCACRAADAASRTSRLAMATFHTPGLVLFALFAMAALAAMAVGSSMAKAQRRSVMHELGFIFVVSLAIMVLLDIEYSRAGFVRIDASDRFLVSLRASMEAGE